MPLPLLALAAIPAIAKAGLGLYQLGQHVNRVDTTTPAEREQEAMARQGQASTLPGMAGLQARLAQTQNTTVQNAQLGAGSGADFLAANSAADRVRQNGEQQLGMQSEQFHQGANQRLSSVLSGLAAHAQADTNRANQANAAFKGSGLTNLFGGLSDGASVAAYGAGLGSTPAHPELAVDKLDTLAPRALSGGVSGSYAGPPSSLPSLTTPAAGWPGMQGPGRPGYNPHGRRFGLTNLFGN